MKKFLQEKTVIGTLCFVLGVGVMFTAQLIWHRSRPALGAETSPHFSKNLDPLFDQFDNDDFFGRSRDSFQEMRKMRERMLKQFGHPQDTTGLFDSWHRKRLVEDSAEIQKREDDHFVYYDVAVKGLDQKNLNVKVENGQIEISGQIEKKSEGEGIGSYFSSSFQRSFPAPQDVDPNRVQMEQVKDKMVIKFPKVKT